MERRYKNLLKISSKKREYFRGGCGIGSICYYLSKKTNAKIIGIDTSIEALRISRSKTINENIQFIRADVNKLPFKTNSFDLIISLGVIEYLNNPKIAVKEMERTLKKNGILFVSTPNAYCYPHTILRFLKKKLKLGNLEKKSHLLLPN